MVLQSLMILSCLLHHHTWSRSVHCTLNTECSLHQFPSVRAVEISAALGCIGEVFTSFSSLVSLFIPNPNIFLLLRSIFSSCSANLSNFSSSIMQSHSSLRYPPSCTPDGQQSHPGSSAPQYSHCFS